MNLRTILFALALCLGAVSHEALAVTCAANMTASNPDAAYTDHGDGTVTHVPTGLMWKRCSEGQSWIGGTCTGAASTHTWAGALALGRASSFAGHADWRLPNLKELRSLVEECRSSPAINDTIFPATPSSYFWSGSPDAAYSAGAWSVEFSNGIASYSTSLSDAHRVRLVRAGQSFVSFDVQKAQTITFGTAPTVVVGGTGTVSATGGASGNAVTFTSGTPSVCIISGSTVTGIAAGACTVAANQAGNSNYNAATQATQNITVGKANQTISFGTAPTVAVGGTGTVTATGGASGNVVTFSSSTTGVCTVSGSTVTGVTAGTCTIAADQGGNANYSAATQVTQPIAIGRANQTLSFGAAPAVAVGGTGTVSATATSALVVSFSSTTPSICTVSGSTVTGVTAGICTIAANQTGNANYNVATHVTQSITVGKTNQSVSFGVAPVLVVGGTGAVTATATSGIATSFTSTTPGVCTVSGSTVTGITAGTCTLAANQAGDANYNAATQVTQSITIGAAAQTVNFGTAPTVVVGGTGTASATGGASGNAVTFSSSTPGVCTVSGSTVTGVTAGTCTLAANQAGNDNYNAAAQVTQNFSVSAQAVPTVSLSPTSLTFTGQSTGVTSAVQTVILTNSGTAALSIAGITASGDFAQSNNCGASVAAGASCTLTITSMPTVAGVRTGTVTITSNAATSPSTISLSGTGTAVSAATLNLVPSWNLVGNSVNAPLDVATALGDTTKVTTVWKWVPATSKWAFYAPSMTAPNLATYAAGKGYDVLATINGGEGFWVNAKAAFSAQLPAGTAISSLNFVDQLLPPNNLSPGWSLIAIGDNKTPRAFATAISTTTPAAGSVPTSLATLWAWDSGLASWYFYAPSLDNSSGLAGYITSKGYRDFGTKTLDPTMGFWVNHP